MQAAEFSNYLDRYANLLIRHGLNIQPGQLLNISTETPHRELGFRVARAAYEAGALYVNLDIVDPRVHRERITRCSLENLNYVPQFLAVKYDELLKTNGANLKIVGPEDPDLFSDLDPQKINASRVAAYNAVKPFYEEGIGKSRVHWTVAAGATQGWGKKVFPDLPPPQAEQALWREIFKICRLESEDYLDLWRNHNSRLRARAERLSSLKLKELHFKGPGTDLLVGLSQKAIFKGGTDESPRKVDFEPNIPTEECFTTPDWRLTSGNVAATRPFFVNGKLIKGLKLQFADGVITSMQADEGLQTFQAYIDSDPGGRRLGEVALVGVDSPVFQSGLVFQEILFDENAACHIAVGSAYKFCLQGGDSLSDEELSSLGCNSSSVHTDIMISSESVDVSGKTYTGESVELISKGRWNFE